MHPAKIALYATDTMADWEYAYLTTQLSDAEQMKPGRFSLVIVGDGLTPVTSMGGLPISPSVDLADIVDDDSLAALVIPGSDRYESGHERLAETTRALLDRDVPVAAICGATFLLARNGLLDARDHTSNAAEYLQMTGYAGGERYRDAPVVTDGGITTASGIRPVPFTAEVMRRVGLFPDDVIDAWEQLNLTADPQYFQAWMEAADAWQKS